MGHDRSRVAVIGYGAMAKSLATSLKRGEDGISISAALIQSRPPALADHAMVFFDSVEALIDWKPALVVECAGYGAVRDAVPRLLAAGIPVVIVSIGALADPELRRRLNLASTDSGKLLLASGAIGGLDALRSASLAGLNRVAYRGVKPPAAWRGTPAEEVVDLATIAGPTVIFEGNAAQASNLYPRNANVTAAVALAGVGFERTAVTLVADPAATGNSHEVKARGAFGGFCLQLENQSLPDNPKTSWLAALSVERAVVDFFQPIKL